MTTNKDIVEYVRTQLDVPWVHQGRLEGQQLDCAGLVVCACKKFGLPYEDLEAYGMRPDKVTMERILNENAIRMPLDEHKLEPGRIVAFWIRKATKDMQHLGITTEDGLMVHGHARRDRIIENRVSGSWDKRLIASYRLKGVQYTWQP